MVCIYFTARQPVDFSFLHYASPSLSIFSLLLSTLLPVFFLPDVATSRLLRPSFAHPSPPSFRPLHLLSRLSLSLVLASRSRFALLRFQTELFVASPFSNPARSARENGLDRVASRSRETDGVMKEFGCARIERGSCRGGWQGAKGKRKTARREDKSGKGSSRMRRSVESCCQTGYKFQVKF